MNKIKNILIVLMILSSIGIVSATTYKHEIGTAFVINNQVYIVTGYDNIGYTVYSDSGYKTVPFRTLDSMSPIVETFEQKLKGFFSVITLSIIGGLPAPDMYGDVNNDGQIIISDAMFIAQYTVNERTFNKYELIAADVNNDGNVTILDSLYIAQYTVNDFKNAPKWRIGEKISYIDSIIPPSVGSLYFTSTPSGASVYMGGMLRGSTPLTLTNLGVGDNIQVEFKATGYYDCTTATNIVTGTTTNVVCTLSKIPVTVISTPIPTTISTPIPTVISTPIPTTISTPIPTAIPTIPKPSIIPPALSRIWNSLVMWLSSWFPLLSIVGGSTVNVPINQPYSTTMSLAFGAPDTVYGDGSYTAKFGQWIVVDSNKNLKYESGWTNELIASPYTVTTTYTPTSAGKYFLVGLINKQTYTWNGAQWLMTEVIETKEVQELVVGLPNVPVTKPVGISFYLNDLFGWLKGLFSWLPW